MDKSEASRNFFGFVGIIAIVLVVMSVGSAFLFGMSEGYDDQEIIDEYNEYIDTWNADLATMELYGESLDIAIDNYNYEVEIYNRARFSDGVDLYEAEEECNDAKADYTYNGMIVKGHLETYRIFLYANEDTLSRNGINVQQRLQETSDWIAEIDYNIQFAGV